MLVTYLLPLFVTLSPPAGMIHFGGFDWNVRQSGDGGPGPNHWSPENVWLDTKGWLHLRLSKKDGKWFASELYTTKRLGYGRYSFVLEGPVDRLDPQIVFGLFPYPEGDIGPDGTHEIDIEFAHWGDPRNDILNYTVWPISPKEKQTSKTFPLRLSSPISRHEFNWSPGRVDFEAFSEAGKSIIRDTIAGPFVSNAPMPLHLNLWCFQGKPPTDGKPVEIVVHSFKFQPK